MGGKYYWWKHLIDRVNEVDFGALSHKNITFKIPEESEYTQEEDPNGYRHYLDALSSYGKYIQGKIDLLTEKHSEKISEGNRKAINNLIQLRSIINAHRSYKSKPGYAKRTPEEIEANKLLNEERVAKGISKAKTPAEKVEKAEKEMKRNRYKNAKTVSSDEDEP